MLLGQQDRLGLSGVEEQLQGSQIFCPMGSFDLEPAVCHRGGERTGARTPLGELKLVGDSGRDQDLAIEILQDG
ncbi:MAG: hypothetical protein QOJ16_4830 [Acidobacteriota bacterium]|nr:hypothetical protein [Acidobacteriota bacterium]